MNAARTNWLIELPPPRAEQRASGYRTPAAIGQLAGHPHGTSFPFGGRPPYARHEREDDLPGGIYSRPLFWGGQQTKPRK